MDGVTGTHLPPVLWEVNWPDISLSRDTKHNCLDQCSCVGFFLKYQIKLAGNLSAIPSPSCEELTLELA